MEEALELSNYLPLSFKTRSEQDYIQFLWEAFESNYENGKYQFALLAYHMLTMSSVYFNIWQIKQTAPEDFSKAMIGFTKDLEKELMTATSPFTFWRVNESSVMRFFKLIGCDNGKIGRYAALVKERNDTAHTNGNIFFSTQAALDTKIREILRVVGEIQTHSAPTIQRCYARFLEESHNPDDREYSEDADRIREVLIHAHYLSQKDIEICAACDIADEFDTHPNFPGIETLHQTLCGAYIQTESAAAVWPPPVANPEP
jgi:hypothetical protein